MKKILSSTLLMTLLLASCATKSPATESTSSGTADSASTVPSSPAANLIVREAVLSEIQNTVTALDSSSSDAAPATEGSSIHETGSVETGSDSRVRLDLLPDGTIIRVGPDSSFVLTSLASEENQPRTKLQLLYGQIFVLLSGGSLDVETPSGVASVRGSLMSVTYSKQLNRTTTTCLEGHCLAADENEELELTEGQAADFIDGELQDDYREMTFEELGLWMLDNPDLQDHLEEFPDLSDIPQDFDWNYDFSSDSQFDFFYDPEYDPGQDSFGSETEVPTADAGEDTATQDPGATEEPIGTQPPISTEAPIATEPP